MEDNILQLYNCRAIYSSLLGWSEFRFFWKLQKALAVSGPRHNTDFRTIDGIVLGWISFPKNGQTFLTESRPRFEITPLLESEPFFGKCTRPEQLPVHVTTLISEQLTKSLLDKYPPAKLDKQFLQKAELTPTGRNWHRSQITVWKGPYGPKTVPEGIIHNYMPCWPTLEPFRDPQGPWNGPKQHQNGPKSTEVAKMSLQGQKLFWWP